MSRPLILLAGLHKTGTTSVQRTCAANARLLRDAGFSYPITRLGERPEANHTRLLNLLFKKDAGRLGLGRQFDEGAARQPPEQVEALRESLSKQVEEVPGLLLVAESVSAYSAEELQALRAWFEARGFALRVMCHVRHLTGWVDSVVTQRVTGGLRLTIAQAVEEMRNHGGLVRKRLETLRSVFPDLEVYSHEALMKHERGPVGGFLEHAGLPAPPELKLVRAKEWRSDCAVRAMSVLNEMFGSYVEGGTRNPRVYNDSKVVEALQAIGGPRFRLGAQQGAPLLASLQEENEWLAGEFGEDFRDPNPQFPRVHRRWTPEAAAQLRSAMRAMPVPVREWMKSNLERLGVPPARRQGSPAPTRH